MNPLVVLEEFSEYPRFADGRIDFSNASKAASVHVVIRVGDEILLVQRSDEVSLYSGLWSGITGYYDEPVSFSQKASEELREEVGFSCEVELAGCLEWKRDTHWVTFFGCVCFDEKPVVVLNEENSAFVWVSLNNVSSYDLLPGFLEILNELFDDF